MTAIDMIREGFYVWADGSLGENVFSTPIIFAPLFLFGFLTTAMLRSIKVRQGVSDKVPAMISREIPSRSDATKLLALESELAASDAALRRLTDTLSTTFAHLSGGMAVFDADSSLHVFNSAICELFDLDPVWLASRPTISEFISKLREKRLLPERKNFWLGESC
jgi:PAS domain-containing protein